MGKGLDVKEDFIWSSQEEPHAARKKEIIQKHPKVNDLMGHEPRTKYIVAALVAAQLALGVWAATLPWWQFILLAWVVGGTINHALMLAVHEISHNLAFRKPLYNQLLAYTANIPIGLPYAAAFRGYHLEHHKQQGHDGVDTDIPSDLETRFFKRNTPVRKFFFLVFQVFFYAVRPMAVRYQKPTAQHALNWAIQWTAVALYVRAFGWLPWVYLLSSAFFAVSLLPTSGHFSEHYTFNKPQETYSYYGPLNMLTWNVGFHNEHHDFPNVPWSRLPRLTKVAPEYYDKLHTTKSWPGTMWDFVTNPEISTFSRVKKVPPQQVISEEYMQGQGVPWLSCSLSGSYTP